MNFQARCFIEFFRATYEHRPSGHRQHRVLLVHSRLENGSNESANNSQPTSTGPTSTSSNESANDYASESLSESPGGSPGESPGESAESKNSERVCLREAAKNSLPLRAISIWPNRQWTLNTNAWFGRFKRMILAIRMTDNLLSASWSRFGIWSELNSVNLQVISKELLLSKKFLLRNI